MDTKYKNLMSDLCFKHVFSHAMILKDFIDSFFNYLNLDMKFKFISITMQDYIYSKTKEVHSYFGDLVATTDKNVIINLEEYSDNFRTRNFNKSYAYMTQLYNKNIKDTETYAGKNIISINIIIGNYKRMNQKLVNEYFFGNKDSNRKITDNNVLYLIRIDKAVKEPYNKGENRFVTWLRLIYTKDLNEMQKLIDDMGGDFIMSETMKFVKEWNAMSAKNGLERILDDKFYDGVDVGKEEGVKIGKEKGKKEGKREGKREGILEIAKNMLKNSFTINDIVKVTNLSKSQIEKLQLELGS